LGRNPVCVVLLSFAVQLSTTHKIHLSIVKRMRNKEGFCPPKHRGYNMDFPSCSLYCCVLGGAMKHEIACETSSEFARIVGNEKLDFAMRTADQRSRQTLGDIDSNRPMEAHRRLVECAPPAEDDGCCWLPETRMVRGTLQATILHTVVSTLIFASKLLPTKTTRYPGVRFCA